MSKPPAWRRDRARYPFHAEVATRFADLDLLGHVNNVRLGELFEEGRGMFNRSLALHRGSPDVRWLVAGVAIAYLAEVHHPGALTIASGIGTLGRSSWTILSAAFDEGGACVATCDTTLVYTDRTGAQPMPEAFRARFAGVRTGEG